jgi:hypothetical protein
MRAQSGQKRWMVARSGAFAPALLGCVVFTALANAGCKKPLPPHTIGLALDVGGRGDQSFNDGALRGLE